MVNKLTPIIGKIKRYSEEEYNVLYQGLDCMIKTHTPKNGKEDKILKMAKKLRANLAEFKETVCDNYGNCQSYNMCKTKSK